MDKPLEPPSGWQIMKAMEIASLHLNAIAAEADPDDPDAMSDAEELLEMLKGKGADVGRLMEALLLAGDEARAEADAIKARRDKLLIRQQRRSKKAENTRKAAIGIMNEFPELFRPAGKSKALLAFKSTLVDARVQRGTDGVIITDPAKLMEQDRFVSRSLNEKAVKDAVLDDGEVLEGVERKNGAPFLVVKTT